MANQYLQPFFDTLSQGVQVAEHLRQAAQQQQALDEAKRSHMAEEQFQQQQLQSQNQGRQISLLESGAHPVDGEGNISGMPMQVPQNSIGADGTPTYTMQQAPPVSVPANPGRTVGVNGQQYEVPTQQELAQTNLQNQLALKGGLQDVDRIPISDDTADKLGVPHGTKLSPEHLAGVGALAHWLNPPDPKAQADPTKTVRHDENLTDDKGNVTHVVTYLDGHTETKPLGQVGKSRDTSADKLANAVAGAGRSLTPDAQLGARQKAIGDYQNSTKEEAQLNSERLSLGTALRNGKLFVSTDAKGNTKLTPFGSDADPDEVTAQQDDMRNRYQAISERLKQVISQKNDALGRAGTKPGVSTEQAWAAIDQGTQQVLGNGGATVAPAATQPVTPAATTATPAAAAPAAAAPAQNIAPNTIIRNPKTGERRQWTGTGWKVLTPAQQVGA